MHAVGAAYDRGELELVRAALEYLDELLQVITQDSVGLLEEETVGGIYYVGGGEALVHPLALVTQ